jgi:hypothetical protein
MQLITCKLGMLHRTCRDKFYGLFDVDVDVETVFLTMFIVFTRQASCHC